jgi:uncharacterized membrane protein
VPPGTNGAISVGGTLGSIAGGGFIGILVGVTMVIENGRCSGEWSRVLFESVAWGMCGGGIGSLVRYRVVLLLGIEADDNQVDSLLGATVQQTRYSKTKRVVLQDENRTTEGVQVVSGINILSNNQVNRNLHQLPILSVNFQVNLVSSVICAVMIGWVG